MAPRVARATPKPLHDVVYAMRRQALRQAAGLARQAGTLTELSSWAPCLALCERHMASGTCGASQGASAPQHPTAAATTAASFAGPWRLAQRRLHSWAARQWPSRRQDVCLAQAQTDQPWQQQQQQRALSAQAEPSSASSASEAAAASDGLTLSDAAVERLKELQAQVGAGTLHAAALTGLPLCLAGTPPAAAAWPQYACACAAANIAAAATQQLSGPHMLPLLPPLPPLPPLLSATCRLRAP